LFQFSALAPRQAAKQQPEKPSLATAEGFFFYSIPSLRASSFTVHPLSFMPDTEVGTGMAGSVRIIALMNQKGGVGKTTTTVNLGAALAEQGKRVCLIDLDPQAHLTINYGIEPSTGGEPVESISLYDVLVEDRGFLEAVHKAKPNIAIVPSSIDLAAADVELVSVPGRDVLLKERLSAASVEDEFTTSCSTARHRWACSR